MDFSIQFSNEQTYLWYLSAVFFATFFAFLSEKCAVFSNGKFYVNKFFWIISFLFLFIPLGFRGYGIDHQSYQLFYDHINLLGHEYNGFPEPLFTLLNYIIGRSLNDFQFVYIFSAFITLFFIYMAFSKRIGKNSLTLCILLLSISSYFYMFGLVRMFLAVGIITYAHKYIDKKNMFKYILWCVVASLFHYSALIMIPLYFIFVYKVEKPYSTKRNIQTVMLALVATPIVFLVGSEIFVNIFGGFQWFSRYMNYFEVNFTLSSLKNIAWAWPMVLIVTLWGKFIARNIEDGRLLIRMFWVFIGISMISTLFPVFRLTFYLYYVVFYLYAGVLKLPFVQQEKKIILFSFYSGIGLFGLIYIYSTFFNSIYIDPFLIPYYFDLPKVLCFFTGLSSLT